MVATHPGADVDDAAPALAPHRWQNGAAGQVRPPHVDCDGQVPLGRAYLQDALAQHHDPGVVHQHVDPAVPVEHLPDHLRDLRFIRHVTGHGKGLSPGGLDVPGGLLDVPRQPRGRLGPGANGHLSPLPGVLLGDGPAQAAAGPGDDSHKPFHFAHVIPLGESGFASP